MTRGRARRYLLTKRGYYPGVVASMGYDVWDWSTLNKNTMFQDSTKLIPAKDQSDPVGCWVDYVKKTDATQLSTPNKPGLDLATLNGLPTLSFDGGDFLATANISISTFAVWVVAKIDSTIDALYAHGASDMYLRNMNTDNLQIRVNKTGGASQKNVTSITGASYQLIRHEFNGTHSTHLLYADDSQLATSDIFSNDPGSTSTTAVFTIGSLPSLSYPLTGNMGQLLIMSPYPTDASILANMESYINNLWNGVY